MKKTIFKIINNIKMQIFIYNTHIKNNFPIFYLTEDEIINLIKKLDYYNINDYKLENSYLIIYNAQLLPNKINKSKYLYAYCPLNIKNILLLYSYKDKMYNKEKEFLEYLENIIIVPKQLNRVVFNKHII